MTKINWSVLLVLILRGDAKKSNKMKQLIIRLPMLYDARGDISKKWFVYYSVPNPKTGKMERFKELAGLKIGMSASDVMKLLKN